jgi:hypothetical protein
MRIARGLVTIRPIRARDDSGGQRCSSVFGLDALRCPRCGGTVRLISVIEDPAIARRILVCVGLPARAPPITAASSSDALSGQVSEVDERWDFDQTPPHDEP